jgi:hypothetical protein
VSIPDTYRRKRRVWNKTEVPSVKVKELAAKYGCDLLTASSFPHAFKKVTQVRLVTTQLTGNRKKGTL